MADLKNPMRFSIKNRSIDIHERLHHPDFSEKEVVEIEFRDDQMYVYWEERDENSYTCPECGGGFSEPVESNSMTWSFTTGFVEYDVDACPWCGEELSQTKRNLSQKFNDE